jgi:sugar phosphate isomerase/epimerase
MSLPVHLCLDEASPDPEVAAALGEELGVEACTVRMIHSGRYPDVGEEDREGLRKLRRNGVRFSSISPGIGKRPFEPAEAERVEHEEFPRAIAGALDIGAKDISIFSWLKTPAPSAPATEGSLSPDAPFEEIASLLKRLAGQATHCGLTLSLEVGYQCWADSGSAAWKLIERAGHPGLRVAWDPCNALSALVGWSRCARDRAFTQAPQEYLARDLSALPHGSISAVHVRDMVTNPGDPGWAYVLAGHGMVDWQDLVSRLSARGYAGPLTIEHHMPAADKIRATRHTASYLSQIGNHHE